MDRVNIVFDYDGTLHNTAHLYGCAVRQAALWLKDQGVEPPQDLSDERMAGYLGVNAPDTWDELLPGLPGELQEKLIHKVGDEMVAQTEAGNAVLYPGVTEMLTRLKDAGFSLFILSNCTTEYMDEMVNHFGLEKWFTDFYPCEAYGFISKEEIFRVIMEEYPAKVNIMVGDRASDMAVGSIGAVRCVGCAYGFGEEGELGGADAIAASPADIPGCVNELQKLSF